VALTFDYQADFADIFEVRGTRRERRGALVEPRSAVTPCGWPIGASTVKNGGRSWNGASARR